MLHVTLNAIHIFLQQNITLCMKASVQNLNLYPNLLCCFAMQYRFELTLDILNINSRKEYNTSLKTVLDVLLPTHHVDQMSAVIQ
jgi:hypothetical protein